MLSRKVLIELTSVLQIQFAISVLLKKGLLDLARNKEGHRGRFKLTVDVCVFHPHVNDTTKKFAFKLLRAIDDIDELNMVEAVSGIGNLANIEYDCVIVRSRLLSESYTKVVTKHFFSKTGNLEMTRNFLSISMGREFVSVDDGMSNWRKIQKASAKKEKIYAKFISIIDRKVVIKYVPRMFRKILDARNIVRSYSIFHPESDFNIKEEYLSVVKLCCDAMIGENLNNIQQLYIGIWPSFVDRDGVCVDSQLKILESSPDVMIDQRESVYIKEHPKHSITINSDSGCTYVKLPEEMSGIPMESLLLAMRNLKSVYTYPNTTAYLIVHKIIDLPSSPKIYIIKSESDEYYANNLEFFM